MNAAGNEHMLIGTANGSVALYHDNVKKAQTDSTGFNIPVNGNYLSVGSNGNSTSGKFGYQNDYELYIQNDRGYQAKTVWDNDGMIRQQILGNDKLEINTNGIKVTGTCLPAANNTHDLGNSTYRWRNVYTNDLNLSNEGSSNDVDGTWGDWTIQEGESDLFLKNNRSGKKYKFNLTEVS